MRWGVKRHGSKLSPNHVRYAGTASGNRRKVHVLFGDALRVQFPGATRLIDRAVVAAEASAYFVMDQNFCGDMLFPLLPPDCVLTYCAMLKECTRAGSYYEITRIVVDLHRFVLADRGH